MGAVLWLLGCPPTKGQEDSSEGSDCPALADARLEPDSQQLFMGEADEGEVLEQVIYLSSVGSAPVESIGWTPWVGDEFQVTIQGATCGSVDELAPGCGLSLAVQFTPLHAGDRSDWLEIVSSDRELPRQWVELSARGGESLPEDTDELPRISPLQLEPASCTPGQTLTARVDTLSSGLSRSWDTDWSLVGPDGPACAATVLCPELEPGSCASIGEIYVVAEDEDGNQDWDFANLVVVDETSWR